MGRLPAALVMSDFWLRRKNIWEKLEAAISHYLEAYRLEPYRAMYAIKAADGMVKMGRKEEALTFCGSKGKTAIIRLLNTAMHRDSGVTMYLSGTAKRPDFEVRKLKESTPPAKEGHKETL